MRKSFKKGIALLTAAALALGSPIAAGNLPIVSGSQTASAAETPVVVNPEVGKTELKDKVESGFLVGYSDYYRFEGDFKASFDLTLDERTGTANWNAPCFFVTTDADRGASGYYEYVLRRMDAWGWENGIADDHVNTNITWPKAWASADEANNVLAADWATYNAALTKGAKINITVEKESQASNAELTMSYTIVTTDDKKYTQVEKRTGTMEDKVRIAFTSDMCEFTITNLEYEALKPPAPTVEMPKTVYSEDFEAAADNIVAPAVGTGEKPKAKVVQATVTETVNGKEETKVDTARGNVYVNDGPEDNYYLLPSNALSSHASEISKNGNISVSLAVRIKENADATTLFAASTGKDVAPSIKIQSDGKVTLGEAEYSATGLNIADGKWHVVTIVLSSSGVKFYVGGEYVGQEYVANKSEITVTKTNDKAVGTLFNDAANLTYLCLGGCPSIEKSTAITSAAKKGRTPFRYDEAPAYGVDDYDYAYDGLNIFAEEIKADQIQSLVYDDTFVDDVTEDGTPVENSSTSSAAPIAPTLMPTPEVGSKPATDFSKIEAQPVVKYTFDNETEEGLTLFGDAKVENGILSLAKESVIKGTTYAQIADLSSFDFSNGITLTADINVADYNVESTKGDWSPIFMLGDGGIGESDADKAEFGNMTGCYHLSQGFSSVGGLTANGTAYNSGYYGNVISAPYTWDYFSSASNRDKWYTITLTIAKDKMVTYINGQEVQSGTADYSDLITLMKSATNNFLGASYFVNDPIFAGSMDNVAIYNQALSAEDVGKLSGGSGEPQQPTQSPDASQAPTQSPDASQAPTEPTQAPDVTPTPDDGKDESTDNNTQATKKKALKIISIKAKAGAKKVTGKVSAKKATVKVKVGKKAYKKAKVKGKKFTLKCAKLKKGTKIKVKATKKNYKKATKTKKVK